MNSKSKNKVDKHENLISSLLINDFIKKKYILKTNSNPLPINNLLLGNMLSPNMSLIPKDIIKKSESTSSTSTDMTYSPNPSSSSSPENTLNKSEKSIITNDDSEIITDLKTVIRIKEDCIIRKTVSAGSIYSSSDDLIILSNLNFLSKIEPNQKIFIIYNDKNSKINFELKIDDSYIPNLSRWYYSQGREKTIEILKKLINISLEQLSMHIDKNNKIEIINYSNLLKSAITGIDNLKITYANDKWIIEELDLIIDKIKKMNKQHV